MEKQLENWETRSAHPTRSLSFEKLILFCVRSVEHLGIVYEISEKDIRFFLIEIKKQYKFLHKILA